MQASPPKKEQRPQNGNCNRPELGKGMSLLQPARGEEQEPVMEMRMEYESDDGYKKGTNR
jgi:hypothetical protein